MARSVAYMKEISISHENFRRKNEMEENIQEMKEMWI
jgi:hypothetical protein